MSEDRLDIAVVGHTNTGKTSLMRTLTRRRDFGEVSPRAATTRHVEAAEMAAPGIAMRLFDTPGLEDSSGLLVHLEEIAASLGSDRAGAIDRFLADPELKAGFGQEAKALAQLRASDVGLYVIDARERVRRRYGDELEILGRTAVPILPVLNFAADAEADEAAWRRQLARVNMHAVIAFDTVVYDEAGELALYRKIATLADSYAPALERLCADIVERRRDLRRAGARVIAEMLVDAAAAERRYPIGDPQAEQRAVDALKQAVRAREGRCVRDLLEVCGFRHDDMRLADLPIGHSGWQEDLFDPELLARYGLSAGGAAATGAAAGVAVDLALGGLTLGAAAATGAGIGLLLETARRHGGRIARRLKGEAVARLDDATLGLLAARQQVLLAALMRRGHGAVAPIDDLAVDPAAGLSLARIAKRARGESRWSSLNEADRRPVSSPRRDALVEDLAARFIPKLNE